MLQMTSTIDVSFLMHISFCFRELISHMAFTAQVTGPAKELPLRWIGMLTASFLQVLQTFLAFLLFC